MNNKILALDTSTNACSVALLVADTFIERYEWAPRQHAQLLLPMVQSLLAEADMKLSQLDAIAFGCGPGSFTGVRIAAGITQGLAFGADLPVIPVSSLQALAQGAYEDMGAEKILAGFDARMQEIYWGAYQLGEDALMIPVSAEALAKAESVTLPAGRDWVKIGDAWGTSPHYPHARDVAKLGNRDYQLNKVVAAEDAIPIYLRSEKAWEQ